MMKRGSSTGRPPLLLQAVVLALLLPSLHAGWDLMAGEEVLVAGEKLLKALGNKNAKDFARGSSWGRRIHKFWRKFQEMYKQSPAVDGMYYPVVDTVAIDWSRLPVITADIADTVAAQIGSCPYNTPAWFRQVGLLGGGGTVKLGTVPVAPVRSCPAVAGAAWEGAVLGLGKGGALSRRFPTFSYLVTEDLNAVVSFPPAPPKQIGGRPTTEVFTFNFDTPNDGRHYIPIVGIRVGPVGSGTMLPARPLGTWQDDIGRTYLSTTEPFTYLESTLYIRLKLALLNRYFQGETRAPSQLHPDQLCFPYTTVTTRRYLPQIAIVFSYKAKMEVDSNNLWYKDGPRYCLAILPSHDHVSILGSFLQRGRLMTIYTQDNITTLTF